MRKTSHDGIDATSITSGIENELKKAGTNISKIKKTSIKRKVQNFSHEADEGIIEPLLQIEKESSEIANRSAKYLLNKSKTDSSYERINRGSDNFALSENTISNPVSSISKIVNNTTKENQIQSAYVYGTAPIHNHMNTNIFGSYDVSKGNIASKNPILVEIDGSKSGVYSPSPLIFTTAKIHTDSKSKLMEPVQTTPVPILSTIEGNVVKTLTNNSEQHTTSFSIKSDDQNTIKCGKFDTNELQSIKGKQLIMPTVTAVSSNEAILNSKEVSCLNERKNSNIKESQVTHSSTDVAGIFNKNQNISQLSNNNSKNVIPTTTNTVNFTINSMKDDITSSGIKKIITESAPATTKSSRETTMSPLNTMTERSSSIDKIKDGVINSSAIKVIKPNDPSPLDLHMVDNTPKNLKIPKSTQCDMKNSVTPRNTTSSVSTKLEKGEKMSQAIHLKDPVLHEEKDTNNIVKISATSVNKKLQRQKNASLEEIGDTTAISSPLTIEKNNMTQELIKSTKKNEKKSSKNSDYYNDGTLPYDKFSTDTKSSTIVTKSPLTSITAPASIVLKSSDCTVSTSTMKIKPTSDVVNLKPTSLIVNTINTTVSNTKDNIKSMPGTSSAKSKSSTKVSSGNTSAMVTFSNPDSYNLGPSSTKTDLSVKCSDDESSVVTTTLPSYIVSTSKTKIGSTLATSTLTSTTISPIHKPFTGVVYTANRIGKNATATEKSNKSTLGTSSNITKRSVSQQTKSKIDSLEKDGRA